MQCAGMGPELAWTAEDYPDRNIEDLHAELEEKLKEVR